MKKIFAVIGNWISADSPMAVGSKALILLAGASAFFFILSAEAPSNAPPTPCSPRGNPARCYRVTEHLCEVVWSNSEKECKEMVAKLALAPGRLTGPIVHQCQLLKFDQALGASRKSDTECVQMHVDLEAWRKRNDIK